MIPIRPCDARIGNFHKYVRRIKEHKKRKEKEIVKENRRRDGQTGPELPDWQPETNRDNFSLSLFPGISSETPDLASFPEKRGMNKNSPFRNGVTLHFPGHPRLSALPASLKRNKTDF